jgi:DNA relaxase NicK
MSSSSTAVFDRVKHLKLKLENETHPRRRKTLQRHINVLLDKEDRRLTDLILASIKRINAALDAFDAEYKRKQLAAPREQNL